MPAPDTAISGLTPLIVASRNGTLENIHLGAIAHVDASGQLLSHAGNARWQSFTRSTLKALQALPLVQAGGLSAFNFNTRQTALLCASHNGEGVHVAEVDGMLAAAKRPYKAMRCGCHLPALYTTGGVTPPLNPVFDERHNNCSGKHAGMLAACVLNGWPTDTYTDINHPLQQAIRSAVADACGLDAAQMPWGIDGCSAPNWAMPLQSLATGFARIAAACSGQAQGVSDATAQAMRSLGRAMSTEPYMVAGTGRNDLAFMQAGRGDWITKVGADAVQVVASISRGEAFALKVADGNLMALHASTVAVLDQLGWLDAAQREQLAPWRSERITNAAGLHVGERNAVFQLGRLQ